jgi:translocation and assembly module TamB
VISDISERRAAAKVSIKSLSISLLPPGIEFHQVKIEKKFSEEERFFSEFGKLGFYIGLIELEEKHIALGEIRILNSVIDYQAPESDEPLPEVIDQKLIDKIFNLSHLLPLRIDTFLVENTRLFYNRDLIEAKKLKLFKRGDDFMTRFHLANLKPFPESDLSIDEIWGDIQIGRKNIDIHRVKVQHDVHSLLLKGKVKNYPKLKLADVTLGGEAHLFLRNLQQQFPLPDIVRFESGFSHLSFKMEMKKRELAGNLDLSVSELESNLIAAEQIVAQIRMARNEIILENLNLQNQKERLRLLSAKKVFDLDSKAYLTQPLTLVAEKLSLNNVLRFLPSLKVLQGEMTGELSLSMAGKNVEFLPKDGFLVENLGLVVGDDKPFPILQIKRAKLSNTSFRVVDKEFQMDSLVQLNHSLLDVQGAVDSKRVSFNVTDAVIDLEDFGDIAKLGIKGKGNLDLKVSGPLDDVKINLSGKTQGFEVLGYKLGAAEKDLSIELRDSNVIIHKFESLYRTTPISGTGAINYDNSDIALGINSSKVSLGDLKEILTPIFSKLDFLPADLELQGRVDASISGKTNLPGLKIKAETQFTDLQAYGETFSSGELVVTLDRQILKLKDFSANKGKGQLRGDFSFALPSNQMNFNYEWDELALSSFSLVKKLKLNFDGLLSGLLVGEGTPKDYRLKLETKIDETRSQDYRFEDSLLKLSMSPSSIAGDIRLLGNVAKADFDYAPKHDRKSKLSLEVNAPSVKPYLVALLGQQLQSKEFTGNFSFSLDSSFKGKFEEVDLKATLRSLGFKHENFQVSYSSNQPQFIIDENTIRRWNLNIQEPDLYFVTKGTGVFGREISLFHEVHFNSRLFEILIAPILSSEGFIRNTVRVDGSRSNYQLSFVSKASGLDMTIASVPFPINDLSYSLDFSGQRLVIHDLRTSLDNGNVSVKGDVFFDGENPDVNLKYIFDKAEFPILGKSLLNISGEGIVLGNEPPYNIAGEITVNKASIINELNEFGSKSSAVSQVRFLPPNQESPVGKYANLNLNVKADNPVRITNSLMDVSLKGELMLLGNPVRPRAEGRLFAPLNSSRIFFKNNEYIISNADLNFTPKKDISNPDFDIQALTFISSYKVQIKAYGDLERFNFDLTSDPSLTRNSILSLIAFGYTDEIQSTLTQGEQQNLTQVGVGSFVFDRFKISDILNKQFGLQVNLGTVFEQSQTDSLLSGRTNQDGQGTLGIGRTRSATKIELRKRLDEALSLSVSSTMGGSIGQRQSMNLNYSLNKKVQLEGVYELRTNEEGLEDVIDNSIGGDLKFRWTFK